MSKRVQGSVATLGDRIARYRRIQNQKTSPTRLLVEKRKQRSQRGTHTINWVFLMRSGFREDPRDTLDTFIERCDDALVDGPENVIELSFGNARARDLCST
jgi:hypothetical protein